MTEIDLQYLRDKILLEERNEKPYSKKDLQYLRDKMHELQKGKKLADSVLVKIKDILERKE